MVRAVATVFGVGYFPRLAGTAGSGVGMLLSWWLSADPFLQMAGTGVVCALGLWCAGSAARKMGKKDPGAIVIDEVAGMMLGLAGLPLRWEVGLTGFLLFRFLDIVKPLGLRRLERLPGSWGIMLDDLAAGMLVNAALRAFLLLG